MKKLKPISSEIQICPDCGKFDAFKDDGHECDAEYQESLREVREHAAET